MTSGPYTGPSPGTQRPGAQPVASTARSFGRHRMPLSPLRLRLLIVSLLTVSFLGALDHTVVATSLATIAGELGAVQQMSWVIVALHAREHRAAARARQARRPHRRPRSSSSRASCCSSSRRSLCGFAQDMTQLDARPRRAGRGSAGLHLMPQTIIGEVTTPRERPRVLSIIGAAFPIAILVGPLAGGLITDAWGWRWVFWINIPVGLVALALAVFAVPHIAGPLGPQLRPRRCRSSSACRVDGARARRQLGERRGLGAASAAWSPPASVAIVGFAAFFAIELRVRRAARAAAALRESHDRWCASCCRPSSAWGCSRSSPTCRPTSRWPTAPPRPCRGSFPSRRCSGCW